MAEYTQVNFIPGEVLTASKMNLLSKNVESIKEGSGLDDGAIPLKKLEAGVFDTAEANLSLAVGGGLNLGLRRYGRFVLVTGGGTVTMPAAGTRTNTVPVDWRPGHWAHILGQAFNSNASKGGCAVRLGPDGRIIYTGTSGHNEYYFVGWYWLP